QGVAVRPAGRRLRRRRGRARGEDRGRKADLRRDRAPGRGAQAGPARGVARRGRPQTQRGPEVREVRAAKKPKPDNRSGERPITLDYGLNKGHVRNPERAHIALTNYMVTNGLRHCTVENREGEAIARAYYTPPWGLTIV